MSGRGMAGPGVAGTARPGKAGHGPSGRGGARSGEVTNYISMGYMIISWRGPHGAGYTYEESNVVDTLLPLNAHDPKEIAHV